MKMAKRVSLIYNTL